MDAIKKKLKDELVKGLDDALALIGTIVSDKSRLYNDYILLIRRYKKNDKLYYNDGVIKVEDYRLEANNIASSIMKFIDSLGNSDINNGISILENKENIFKSIEQNLDDLSNYRNPTHKAESIVTVFNELNLIVGECIEVASYPNFKPVTRIEDFGWNPFTRNEISLDYNNAKFPIGDLKFANDDNLKGLHNGRKFCLTKLTGALTDEPSLSLQVKHSDFFTIKSLLNSYESNLPIELIETFGSFNPEVNKIPHSLCLHNIIFLDDGNVLLQLRAEDLKYHPNKYSLSHEEQLSEEDFQSEMPPMARLMVRALYEEIFPLIGNGYSISENYKLYLEPIIDSIKIWSVFIESNIFNYSILGFTKLNINIHEYCQMYKNFKNNGQVDREGTFYFTSLQELERLLKNNECSVTGVFNKKDIKINKNDLHPTSLYRIYKFLVQLKMV